MEKISLIKWLLRIGVFLTFIGHGMFAYTVKGNWITYLTTAGFNKETAIFLMPWIGILDFIVAFIVLVYPIRIVVLWALFWTLATALIRPISGESIWDFIERGSNWTIPLVLLVLQGLPKKPKDWFSK